MLVMKTNYNSKISPFTFDYVNSKVVPVNVNISMAVIDVLSILEKDLLYVLKFRFYMSWYDYRLKYHNIKRSKMLNSLSSNEVNKLWIPFVVFSNTENSEFTEGNKETEVTISREGDFTESSLDIVEEINIFEGSQNRITFQQIYSKTFRCLYELQLYPFDSQVMFKIFLISHFMYINALPQKCTVDMDLRDLDKTTVNLIPESIFMEGDTLLVQYIIKSWTLERKNISRLFLIYYELELKSWSR